MSAYSSGESDCTYRLWPHRHQCAGSFAASVRSDQTREAEPAKRKRRRKQERLPTDCADWYDGLPERYQMAGAVIWCWPEDAPDWVESVAACGPELAYRTGRTWKPSHDAALRRQGRIRGSRSIEVDAATARSFLSGQPIACDASRWCVVRHQGRPLGWVKASRGTGKNHLPGAARMTW